MNVPASLPVADRWVPWRPTGWRAQFGNPSGWFGRLAGRAMLRSNESINVAVARYLGPRADERVLEVGFGPGRLIELLTARVTNGLVAGAELSATMVDAAQRRNQTAVAAGRVDLRHASVSELPFADASFDTVVAVNNIQFWPTPVRDLGELARVLRPGGRLVLCVRVRSDAKWFLRNVGLEPRHFDQIAELVREAGYDEVRFETIDVGDGVSARVISARRG